MKGLILTGLFLLIPQLGFTQAVNETDSIKKGWNIGFLPAIAFDSDLGIYYGIIINPYDYGNGSRYPDYMQSVLLQVAGYSRGSSEHYIDYDSFTLIPGVRFLSGMKYVSNRTFPFYGFNGNSAVYNHSWEDTDDPAYRTRVFYRQDRRVVKLYANIQDTIGRSRFQWHAGIELNSYKTDRVNIEKLNRKLDEIDFLPDVLSLYEIYTSWGLIRESEKYGGLSSSLLAGIMYDSRNRLTNPDRGFYTEVNIRWMPSFLSREGFSGINVGVIHRQYVSLIRNRLTFAYRVWLNADLGGDQPYYTRQLLTTFAGTEGFGGSGTIRGVLMQRIIASDFLLLTGEFRSRLINFRFINQNWYIGAVAFMDAGRIIKPVHLDMSLVPPSALEDYFRQSDHSIHKSAGGGLKLAMNENFVLSAEYAVPFDPQDGRSGLYLGLNYLF